MSCKNANDHININSGHSYQFQCTSSEKFKSCLLERNTKGYRNHCEFKFHKPFHFGGNAPTLSKELQRVGWNCDLDSLTPNRIQIVEKHNEKSCHLKIDSLGTQGNKIVPILNF